ncbi:hypothetical protein YC2023_042124 [Brassica napus]
MSLDASCGLPNSHTFTRERNGCNQFIETKCYKTKLPKHQLISFVLKGAWRSKARRLEPCAMALQGARLIDISNPKHLKLYGSKLHVVRVYKGLVRVVVTWFSRCFKAKGAVWRAPYGLSLALEVYGGGTVALLRFVPLPKRRSPF